MLIQGLGVFFAGHSQDGGDSMLKSTTLLFDDYSSWSKMKHCQPPRSHQITTLRSYGQNKTTFNSEYNTCLPTQLVDPNLSIHVNSFHYNIKGWLKNICGNVPVGNPDVIQQTHPTTVFVIAFWLLSPQPLIYCSNSTSVPIPTDQYRSKLLQLESVVFVFRFDIE